MFHRMGLLENSLKLLPLYHSITVQVIYKEQTNKQTSNYLKKKRKSGDRKKKIRID